MTGFDASGHIAEETKNARYVISPSLFLLLTFRCIALLLERAS